MKFIRPFAIAALTMSWASSASAGSYIFGYTFDTGQKVTGSFDGTADGALIKDLTNVHVKIDGVALTGSLVAHGYTGYMGPGGSNCGQAECFNGSAVASADPALNNFLFADYINQADFPGSNYFYVIPWTNGGNNQVATQALLADGTQIDHYNGNFAASRFSVAPVPEPATWAMMLMGFGMVGFGLRSRRKPSVRVTFG